MTVTSSPSSRSESSAFGQLHPSIQRWIWTEGWSSLRAAQEQAIPLVLEERGDVLIAASTAEGKTEAAFLPVLSRLLEEGGEGAVLYISPLKALINDQQARLDRMTEGLDIPVTGWHGDISASKKQRFLKHARGILLITPESLEAMFVTRGSQMPHIIRALRFIVVDEFHAFIGTERGKQLQMQLHRLELAAGRTLPRIALSATLGRLDLAAEFLRPGAPEQVAVINANSNARELRVQVRGYLERKREADYATEGGFMAMDSTQAIADHLYRVLAGSNNLVFPPNRRLVEAYTRLLAERCEKEGRLNEFYAHHGSLSKDLREEAEGALKESGRAATAVCTSTLELGIDIGAVKAVCQLGAPPSVASLRQRLGRSGRRQGEPAVLRAYCVEPPVGAGSSLSDLLREELIQTVAMIRLLVQNWFEPPRANGLHASTLVQQILSIIAERGGERASALWALVASSGLFPGLTQSDFVQVLRSLGKHELIFQDATGLLLHGRLGEKLANHYDFYASFEAVDEFRLVCGSKTLGALPVRRALTEHQRIVFGGRVWRVATVDMRQRVVVVEPDQGGAPPMFTGEGAMIHDRVRAEMRDVLMESGSLVFLNEEANALVAEARRHFHELSLANVGLRKNGEEALLLTWAGDWVNDALVLLLASRGLKAVNEGVGVRVMASVSDTEEALRRVSRQEPTSKKLLESAQNVLRSKWDWALPEDVHAKSFCSLYLDVPGALSLIRSL